MERNILIATSCVNTVYAVLAKFGRFSDPKLFTKTGTFTQMLHSIGTPQCTIELNKLTMMCGHFEYNQSGISVEIQDGKNVFTIAWSEDEWKIIIKKFSYVCAYLAIRQIENDDDLRILFPLSGQIPQRVQPESLKEYLEESMITPCCA